MSDVPPTFIYTGTQISRRKAGLHENSLRRNAGWKRSTHHHGASNLLCFYRGSEHKRFPSSYISAAWERFSESRRRRASTVRSRTVPAARATTMPTKHDTTEIPRIHRGRERRTVEEESQPQRLYTKGEQQPADENARRRAVYPTPTTVTLLLQFSTPLYSLYHGSRQRERDVLRTRLSLPRWYKRSFSWRWGA
jgi:hypothetical protein